MSPSPPANLNQLPGGARFFRCALQVNPHHYAATYSGQPSATDEPAYVAAMVTRAHELGIEVLALTDHNHVGAVDEFRAAAAPLGITILPGFELSSSEGIHVLCIYPPDTARATLERHLGGFGIANTAPNAQLANLTFGQILAKVRDQAGLAIAAHVTSAHGLLTTLAGQPRILAWTDANLLAAQIPGNPNEVPIEHRQIVLNKDPAHHRILPAFRRSGLALVNASDVKAPDDLAKPGASCWIKMSHPSVDGLRQAFLDPDVRIRLGKSEAPKHPRLLSIRWQGGFLDGQAMVFNPGLNVLIGGRGTGKSTVIESIRYAFGLLPDTEQAQRSHLLFVKEVLGAGTRIEVALAVEHPTEARYSVERVVPNPPVVRDEAGAILDIAPDRLLPGLAVFGQHEISALARDPVRRTRLLHRFLPSDGSWATERQVMIDRLEKSRADILRVDKQLLAMDEKLAGLPLLENTLAQYEAAGVRTRLQERTQLWREERVFQLARERIDQLEQALVSLREALPMDVAFVSEAALAELPRKDILAGLAGAVAKLDLSAFGALLDAQAAIAAARTAVGAVEAQWHPHKEQAQAAYEGVLRELQKERLDGQEFVRMQAQVDLLKGELDARLKVEQVRDLLLKQRTDLVTEWEAAKAGQLRALSATAKKVNRQLEDAARMTVLPGDGRAVCELLRKRLTGRLDKVIDRIETDPAISLPQLATWIRAGASTLARELSVPLAQADTVCAGGPELAMLVEELELPVTTNIELNVAEPEAPPEFKEIERLSTGQTATAILLVVLLAPRAPVVVDQPEDDLDNRFIAEGIVPRLRTGKGNCQFVVSSHNANIPVLGDADLVVSLQAASDSGRTVGKLDPAGMGAIDDSLVRQRIEQILEGGRAAFETRRAKYGY